ARTLQPPAVAAQCETEHVGADFAAQPLGLELASQLEKHAIGEVGERGARATTGGQLCDQNHRLTHHLIDQDLSVHAFASGASLRTVHSSKHDPIRAAVAEDKAVLT